MPLLLVNLYLIVFATIGLLRASDVQLRNNVIDAVHHEVEGCDVGWNGDVSVVGPYIGLSIRLCV